MDFVQVKLDRLHAVPREPEVRVDCECKGVYIDTPSRRLQHLNTKKHQLYEYNWFMKLTESQVRKMLECGPRV